MNLLVASLRQKIESPSDISYRKNIFITDHRKTCLIFLNFTFVYLFKGVSSHLHSSAMDLWYPPVPSQQLPRPTRRDAARLDLRSAGEGFEVSKCEFCFKGETKNLRKSFKITHIYRRFPNQWIRRKIRNHVQQFQQITGTDLKSQLNILIEWKVDAWWKNECWCFFEETSGKLTAHDTIYDAHVQRTQSQQTI